MTDRHIVTRDEDGEIIKPVSEQAKENIQRPPYWRNAGDALHSYIGSEFEKALAEVQIVLGAIIEKKNTATLKGKSKSGKDYSMEYSYTSLPDVLAKVMPVIQDKGFTIRQYTGKLHTTTGSSGGLFLPLHTKITLVKDPIQNEVFVMEAPLRPMGGAVSAQSVGDVITYLRRYAILSYFGLAPADNDAAIRIGHEQMEEEYNQIAEPIINGMRTCETKSELRTWSADNAHEVQLNSKPVVELVRDAYKLLYNDLPEIKPEDESQLDLEQAIKEKEGK